MQKPDTKQRILEQTAALFYAEGFNNTGMEKITEVCGIRKPALYYHFGSKNELGLAYLEYKSAGLFAMLGTLIARSESFTEYLTAWANAYIVLARRGEFFGCAFTAFASELDAEERKFFSARLRKIEADWLALQERAITKFHPESKAAKTVAQQILIAHTGCVMLFRAARDTRYLKQMKSAFAEIARSVSKL